MSPKLAWIVNERIRAGYNDNASLEWYLIAMECGMNTIFSRLEIANEPSGDVDLLKTILPGERKPEALRSYELIKPSSRRAKELGLHWFYMLNLAASRGNYDDGMRNNSRRYNNGRLFAPTDEIYWTRVVENRFLRVAKMLRGNEFAIDGFLIDPEMYAPGRRHAFGADGRQILEEKNLSKSLRREIKAMRHNRLAFRHSIVLAMSEIGSGVTGRHTITHSGRLNCEDITT